MGLPLLSGTNTPNTFERDKHLTYAIYWKPRPGGILPDALKNGHAAVIIDSYQFDIVASDNYVSWLGTGSGAVSRGAASAYHVDMQDWGGHPHPANPAYRVPTKWVAVYGLDQQAMRDAWANLRGKQGGANWKLLDKNCATVAARILKAGGGDRFARGWLKKNQLVWWPTDVIQYAESMGGQVYRTSSDNQSRFNVFPA
jgi:hypothetical protein